MIISATIPSTTTLLTTALSTTTPYPCSSTTTMPIPSPSTTTTTTSTSSTAPSPSSTQTCNPTGGPSFTSFCCTSQDTAYCATFGTFRSPDGGGCKCHISFLTGTPICATGYGNGACNPDGGCVLGQRFNNPSVCVRNLDEKLYEPFCVITDLNPQNCTIFPPAGWGLSGFGVDGEG